ncbi:hypothetical protein DENIS_4384 [Desulfonema ishimotonii]|uniref:Dicarboxylate transport domain-containing protein n=1 Tax=Desulfonema ishimotonii TaxID=45657 RepID=A0A401G2D6_9BACT|nr:YdbH domain-containing protein [Desulfonema ishimotonii]GBC63390.1 hypothetical protein DENIS_4384 [Desulfonema ishimotonii]
MLIRRRTIGYGLILFTAFFFCLSVVLWIGIPAWLNSPGFLQHLRDAGFRDFSWHVRRVGFTGADVGHIRIGPEDGPPISIRSVQIDYSVSRLFRREIDGITISGVELHCDLTDGNLTVRGLDPALFSGTPRQETPSADAPFIPPVSVGHITLRNAVLIFNWHNSRFRIPVALTLSPRSRDIWHGALRISPRGQNLMADADYHLLTRTLQLKLRAPSFETERFADLVSRVPGLFLAGDLTLNLSAELKTSPFSLSGFQADCEFRNRASRYEDLIFLPFQPRPDLSASESTDQPHGQATNPPSGEPVRLVVRKEAGGWAFSLSDFALASPVAVGISRVDGTLKETEAGFEIDGSGLAGLLKADPEAASGVFGAEEPFHLGIGFSGSLARSGEWAFVLKNGDGDVNLLPAWRVRTGDMTLNGKSPVLDIAGKGAGGGGELRYRIDLAGLTGAAPAAEVRLPSLALSGLARSDASGATATVTLDAPGTSVKAGETDVQVAELSLSVRLNRAKDAPFRADGKLTLAGGKVRGSGIQADGIRISLPLQWPWADSEKAGRIVVTAARWDRMNIGALDGFIRQTPAGFAFGGKHRSKLLPGAVVRLSGESGFMGQPHRTVLRFDTRHKVVSPLDLGRFAPAAKGITLSGALTVTGEMISDKTGLKLGADTVLEKAELRMEKNGIVVDGCEIRLSLPDLIGLRSAPGQQVRAKRIAVGNILLEDADFRFQIESPRSFLIEKGKFAWCGGNVTAQALRILSGGDDYDLLLYCDRLKLARVLAQLGGASAEGEGTVNGRIPVRFRAGAFSFDDGFLYSTPGDGGVIHLTGGEFLTAGIPEDTPQFNQIELARAALKDYEYQWVRLRLNSEEDDLMLGIRFDGKPLHPLPFVYKEDFGGFIRSGTQLSRFQGIRLNVNLLLPLNKLLRYRGVLDSVNNN